MFNLIVGGNVSKDWDGGEITGWGGRAFLTSEGTSEAVLDQIKPSGREEWDAIETLPTLMTPEKQFMETLGGARAGSIARIRVKKGDYSFHFTPYPGIPPLAPDDMEAILEALGVDDRWHYRTHWAVHDGDLLAAIAKRGILAASSATEKKLPAAPTSPSANLISEVEAVIQSGDSLSGLVQAREQGRVFIVHGHNEGRKHEVARFLRDLVGSEPIILHEQGNRGMTIIEKFELHAGIAGYAVALLTSDDRGRAYSEDTEMPRARQNVIFEAGFFTGRLGRSHVALLHDQGVELPSDLAGVVYIPLAGDDWRIQLARELQGAGFPVDWSLFGRR